MMEPIDSYGAEYDDDNWNARSYLTHHMQRISSDIVMGSWQLRIS